MTIPNTAPDRTPILWIALGRQRVGKTAVLSSAVQFFRHAGSLVQVWNADQQNRSHSLSQFFPDAETVPAGGIEDAKAWIEERLEHLIEHRYDAVLDVGGGATGFTRLVEECHFWRGLSRARSGWSVSSASGRSGPTSTTWRTFRASGRSCRLRP